MRHVTRYKFPNLYLCYVYSIFCDPLECHLTILRSSSASSSCMFPSWEWHKLLLLLMGIRSMYKKEVESLNSTKRVARKLLCVCVCVCVCASMRMNIYMCVCEWDRYIYIIDEQSVRDEAAEIARCCPRSTGLFTGCLTWVFGRYSLHLRLRLRLGFPFKLRLVLRVHRAMLWARQRPCVLNKYEDGSSCDCVEGAELVEVVLGVAGSVSSFQISTPVPVA